MTRIGKIIVFGFLAFSLLPIMPGLAAAKPKEQVRADRLAAPEDIKLKGNIRREEISTPVGRVELRWPRSVELLFGRNPLHAMTDAARTVNQAIRTSSFPRELQNLNADWQVVFMDENLPETQIPYNLISNCHPGWMTPPANIYIVAQRVAAGCNGGKARRSSVADADLAKVLIHEMGHAVEFQLLQNEFGRNRMRAEGFATWFEGYAASYSSTVNRNQLKEDELTQAKYAIKKSPGEFAFSGDSLDYARASMYFSAIVDRRGLSGLMDVYKAMVRDHLDFFPAIQKELGWSRAELEKEVTKYTEKN
jgi:hypothetical protein